MAENRLKRVETWKKVYKKIWNPQRFQIGGFAASYFNRRRFYSITSFGLCASLTIKGRTFRISPMHGAIFSLTETAENVSVCVLWMLRGLRLKIRKLHLDRVCGYSPNGRRLIGIRGGVRFEDRSIAICVWYWKIIDESGIVWNEKLLEKSVQDFYIWCFERIALLVIENVTMNRKILLRVLVLFFLCITLLCYLEYCIELENWVESWWNFNGIVYL